MAPSENPLDQELVVLQKILAKLRVILRDKMRADWQRVLPFQELLSDRWEKADYLGFEEKASIYDSSYVYGDVKVGRHSWVGPFTILDGSGGELVIGNYCSISAGVQIYTHDTVKWAVSGGKANYEKGSTRIGDYCYIGPLVVISKGVSVGEHSVIGAHSLVNRDIPPYSIAFGTPCRVVGRVYVNDKGEVQFTYDQ